MDMKRLLALWGTLIIVVFTGAAVYLLAAYMVYIVVGGFVLSALISTPFLVQSWHLRHLPLKQHYTEAQRLAHEQEMERERLVLEREKQEAEQRREDEKHQLALHLDLRTFELRQHQVLSYVQADEHGYYPYKVTQDGGLQHLPNPHLSIKQIAPKEEEKIAVGLAIPAKYDLRTIWQDFTPSTDQIFLGMTTQGPIYVPLRMLWHIALTGPTGGGKTSILRALLMQLAYLRCDLTLCDIHYAPIKSDGRGQPIDWRPIEQRLSRPVIRDIQQTAEWLQHLAYSELQARIDRQYRGEQIGRPLFFTIEELPAVLDEAGTGVADPLAKILRQGRQYDICFVGASQDLLTKTLRMSQGPRECFRTGYYTGGDPLTAKALLDLRNGEKIDEEGIGIDGLVYLKTAMHPAMQTRVGWASNEALYDLLDVPHSERLGPMHSAGRRASVIDTDLPDFSTFSRHNHDGPDASRFTIVQPVEQLDVTSEERPKEYKFSDVEIPQFIAAYKASGNIGKALAALGRGGRYKRHASEIVRVHNLRREA